jgi:hypothetical protein
VHRLARCVHLPVFGQFPVERLAQSFQDMGHRLVPPRRSHERLGDCEPSCLQDLIALSIADVDDHDLEMEGLARFVSHQARIDIGP